jgi:hypothetical protein
VPSGSSDVYTIEGIIKSRHTKKDNTCNVSTFNLNENMVGIWKLGDKMGRIRWQYACQRHTNDYSSKLTSLDESSRKYHCFLQTWNTRTRYSWMLLLIMNIAVILLTLHDTKSKSNLNYLSINYIMTNKSFGFRLEIVRTDGQYVYLILILNATVGTYAQRQKPQKFKWIWIWLYWDP